MKYIALVAPYLGASMLHCIRCFVALEDVAVGLITQGAMDRIPAALRSRLAGHYRIRDALDAAQLVAAGEAFAKEWGRLDGIEGYLEQLQVPLGDARDALGVEGLGGEAARNFRDKNRMKAALSAAGLPVARQALVHSGEDARRFVDEVGFPVVLKPLDGAGARDTVRVLDPGSLAAALNRLMPSAQAPVQAEAFVQGEEHTLETVAIDGEPVWWSSTFYLPGPLAVLENPWMQYCLLLPREQAMPHAAAFAPTGHQALKTLGLRSGLAHMEWFQQASGDAVISEVGARPPGANIMLLNGAAHEVDMWAKWARLMVHRTWQMPPRRYAVGCAFVRGMGRGRIVRSITGLEETQARIAGTIWRHQLPQVGQPRSPHYEGDGWVIVRHPETQRVVEALRTIVTTLRIELGG